ncbi:MAG: hypothetical protein LRZ84_05495 [Desertifilum sp.]|nr:hypothetical protein [Desertifilum sp.]
MVLRTAWKAIASRSSSAIASTQQCKSLGTTIMTQTQSNYADLFSTDDRIRINALKAISPQKTPFEIVKSLGKTDPKWNPTQAQLITAIHGVTQLVMWLNQAERRFPHFDLVIHYKFDEFQKLARRKLLQAQTRRSLCLR